jgi:biotin synthase-like enzyme
LLSIFSVEAQARHVTSRSAARASAIADTGNDPFKPIELDDSPSDSTANQSQQMGYLSKYYFEQVTDIVEMVRKHKSKTIGAMGRWNDQKARQIDELNTLNVDPDMIQYGSDVSEMLRGNAITVRKGAINAQKHQSA